MLGKGSAQGPTYHRSGLADGHKASEEVFIVQLAENMGVVGYHNGDLFHHLASWPVHSGSCYPGSRSHYPGGKNPTAAQCQCPHPPVKGWSIKNPQGKKENGGGKKSSCYHWIAWPIGPSRKLRSLICEGSTHYKHLLCS